MHRIRFLASVRLFVCPFASLMEFVWHSLTRRLFTDRASWLFRAVVWLCAVDVLCSWFVCLCAPYADVTRAWKPISTSSSSSLFSSLSGRKLFGAENKLGRPRSRWCFSAAEVLSSLQVAADHSKKGNPSYNGWVGTRAFLKSTSELKMFRSESRKSAEVVGPSDDTRSRSHRFQFSASWEDYTLVISFVSKGFPYKDQIEELFIITYSRPIILSTI